jgi:hypothetical protein
MKDLKAWINKQMVWSLAFIAYLIVMFAHSSSLVAWTIDGLLLGLETRIVYSLWLMYRML